MKLPAWITTFDLETTGVNSKEDRIVQAFLGRMGPDGEWIEKREWIIDPGIEIPTGASDVHGYTTERIRKEGRKDAFDCIQEIESTLQSWTGERFPLVIYNAAFDTTFLNAEMQRHEYQWTLMDDFSQRKVPVIDPYVADKAKDKFRKGSRKLVDVAPIYGVPVEANAHDAGADCLMTGRIALKMLESWKGTLAGLHEKQVGWKREQAESLQAYFSKTNKRNDDGSEIVINPGWPFEV